MVNWLASRAILWLLAASLSLAAQFGAVEGGQDANDSMWTLTGYDFNQSSFTIQPYVSNGYIGQRLPVTGFGYSEIQPLGPQNGTNGWPLFDVRFTAAMVAGFYHQQPNTTGTNFDQTGGQQPISTIPTWSSLYLTVNGTTLQPDVNPDQISNWNQSMSIQHGVVQTAYEWMPSGATGPLSVKYTSFAHRTRPNLGVIRLDISGGHLQGVSVTDVLDVSSATQFATPWLPEADLKDASKGQGAHRVIAKGSGALANHSNTIYSSVSPIGIDNVTCVEMSSLRFVHGEGNLTSSSEACYLPPPDATTASQCYSVSPEGGSVSIVKYVGIASSDAFPESESQTAEFTIQTAIDTGYTALLEEHKRAWADLWDSADIVIPGEEQKQLQLAVRASFFHLLSNVRQGSEPKGLGDNSIAPAGLTSDSYAGQVREHDETLRWSI